MSMEDPEPKAAWEMVCLPKEEGGLGIINIETQNQALLMKNLDKFFNKKDIPWVNIVWENTIKMEDCLIIPKGIILVEECAEISTKIQTGSNCSDKKW